MKLVFCLECADIFSPGNQNPTRCKCGYSVAKWRDAQRGTLEVASRMNEEHLRILGINNDWLYSSIPLEDMDILHRNNTQRTCDLAVGYLFQTQARNSAIIMFRPDESQVFYVPGLLEEIEWHGKFDCAL